MLAPKTLVQKRDISGHWAVEVNWDIGNRPFALQLIQVIHQQLSAPDRERWHQGNPSAQCRASDDVGQLRLWRFDRMLTITVGRLHQQIIRLLDRFGRKHQWIVRPAQIP
ncbi:hypothetical protein D9M71_655880 [compost metagenome]